MMKLYAIQDIKADAFQVLHPCATDAIAKRDFAEACMDPKSQLAKYPEDYRLFQVGEWEPNTGELRGLPTPKFLASAFELIQAMRQHRAKVEPELPFAAEVVK